MDGDRNDEEKRGRLHSIKSLFPLRKRDESSNSNIGRTDAGTTIGYRTSSDSSTNHQAGSRTFVRHQTGSGSSGSHQTGSGSSGSHQTGSGSSSSHQTCPCGERGYRNLESNGGSSRYRRCASVESLYDTLPDQSASFPPPPPPPSHSGVSTLQTRGRTQHNQRCIPIYKTLTTEPCRLNRQHEPTSQIMSTMMITTSTTPVTSNREQDRTFGHTHIRSPYSQIRHKRVSPIPSEQREGGLENPVKLTHSPYKSLRRGVDSGLTYTHYSADNFDGRIKHTFHLDDDASMGASTTSNTYSSVTAVTSTIATAVQAAAQESFQAAALEHVQSTGREYVQKAVQEVVQAKGKIEDPSPSNGSEFYFCFKLNTFDSDGEDPKQESSKNPIVVEEETTETKNIIPSSPLLPSHSPSIPSLTRQPCLNTQAARHRIAVRQQKKCRVPMPSHEIEEKQVRHKPMWKLASETEESQQLEESQPILLSPVENKMLNSQQRSYKQLHHHNRHHWNSDHQQFQDHHHPQAYQHHRTIQQPAHYSDALKTKNYETAGITETDVDSDGHSLAPTDLHQDKRVEYFCQPSQTQVLKMQQHQTQAQQLHQIQLQQSNGNSFVSGIPVSFGQTIRQSQPHYQSYFRQPFCQNQQNSETPSNSRSQPNISSKIYSESSREEDVWQKKAPTAPNPPPVEKKKKRSIPIGAKTNPLHAELIKEVSSAFKHNVAASSCSLDELEMSRNEPTPLEFTNTNQPQTPFSLISPSKLAKGLADKRSLTCVAKKPKSAGCNGEASSELAQMFDKFRRKKLQTQQQEGDADTQSSNSLLSGDSQSADEIKDSSYSHLHHQQTTSQPVLYRTISGGDGALYKNGCRNRHKDYSGVDEENKTKHLSYVEDSHSDFEKSACLPETNLLKTYQIDSFLADNRQTLGDRHFAKSKKSEATSTNNTTTTTTECNKIQYNTVYHIDDEILKQKTSDCSSKVSTKVIRESKTLPESANNNCAKLQPNDNLTAETNVKRQDVDTTLKKECPKTSLAENCHSYFYQLPQQQQPRQQQQQHQQQQKHQFQWQPQQKKQQLYSKSIQDPRSLFNRSRSFSQDSTANETFAVVELQKEVDFRVNSCSSNTGSAHYLKNVHSMIPSSKEINISTVSSTLPSSKPVYNKQFSCGDQTRQHMLTTQPRLLKPINNNNDVKQNQQKQTMKQIGRTSAIPTSVTRDIQTSRQPDIQTTRSTRENSEEWLSRNSTITTSQLQPQPQFHRQKEQPQQKQYQQQQQQPICHSSALRCSSTVPPDVIFNQQLVPSSVPRKRDFPEPLGVQQEPAWFALARRKSKEWSEKQIL